MRIATKLPMPVRHWYRGCRDSARAAIRDIRCWNYTEDDVRAIYAGGYHDERGYSRDDAEQLAIKVAHAEFVWRHASPGKIVEAGCSNGELVRQLRGKGADAWGFDITSDLDRIAYPDVRPYLRTGSLLEPPYSSSDGFGTLVAVDVFEHIPRRRVRDLVRALDSLGVNTLVTLINHISVNDPGHISLYPLSWWQWKLWPTFRLRPEAELDRSGLTGVYGLDPDDAVHVLRVWDRVA